MTGDDYKIRALTRAEMELAIEWAAAEGWNPGLHDADTFFPADPAGFLAGELDGEVIATKSAVSYGKHYAFLGFYIVKPEFRGRGYGFRLWQHALAGIDGKTIGMDGVVAQQANYRKSGFTLHYRNIRQRFTGEVADPGGTMPLAKVPIEQLIEYDAAIFPAPRLAFLSNWLKQTGSIVRCVVDADEFKGYGVIRPCREGFKIGPLFCDNDTVADTLFQSLASHAAGQPVYLDTPEPNDAALQLAARYGMQPVFETARMYLGDAPDEPLRRIFGVTTFELG